VIHYRRAFLDTAHLYASGIVVAMRMRRKKSTAFELTPTFYTSSLNWSKRRQGLIVIIHHFQSVKRAFLFRRAAVSHKCPTIVDLYLPFLLTKVS